MGGYSDKTIGCFCYMGVLRRLSRDSKQLAILYFAYSLL